MKIFLTFLRLSIVQGTHFNFPGKLFLPTFTSHNEVHIKSITIIKINAHMVFNYLKVSLVDRSTPYRLNH